MTIISIRGTSGSGKSTLARRVMECYDGERVTYRGPMVGKPRKQPHGYLLQTTPPGRPLFVPGHYETACGGCDTLPSYDVAVEMINNHAARGHDVMFEGLLWAPEVTRTVELHKRWGNLHIIGLCLPLDVCLASVNARRHEKNPDKPDVNPKNTESKWRATTSVLNKLEVAGLPVHRFEHREAAFEKIVELLNP